MNISIFASIWCQNLWDELILKNEIKLLEHNYISSTEGFNPLHKKDIKFNVFTYDIEGIFYKKENVKYLEYFPIWIRNPKNIIKNVKNFLILIKIIISSDLIVIWWWWLFFDTELQKNKNPLNLWLFRTKLFYLFRKKVTFYWVWLNIKQEENLDKIKKIFRKAHEVYVRDSYSQNLLEKLWIESKNIWDPVFFDNTNVEEISVGKIVSPFFKGKVNWFKESREYVLGQSTWSGAEGEGLLKKSYCLKQIESKNFTYKDLKDINLKWKKIWIWLRKWYISQNPEQENKIMKEIIEYILKKWWKIILLPHSFHKTDSIANDHIFLKKYLKYDDKIKIAKTMKEVYDIYRKKKIDICLAERLHSIILSQVYQIDFIAISYSTKTKEVLKKITNL